ncbi:MULTISPECIES: DUF2742 domain-containing protein [unclassified Nocardiopsis]|uniref:DUF2742 domain-containing protein n=1 Tax=Nocardiopsis TaxID=2013 RepID=UPI00387AEC4D
MTPQDRAAHWAASQWQKWPTVPHITDEQRHRRQWSQTIIDRGKDCGPLPLFGSREWCQLADDDPRKAAAAVRAAEAWAREGDDLGFTIAQEAYNRRRADDEFWNRMFARRRGMVNDHLARVRVNEQRAKPTTSAWPPYAGGPVDWETNEGGARGLLHRDSTDAA